MKVGALSKKSFELVFLSLVSYTSHGVSQVHFQSLKILIASLDVVDSHFDLNVILNYAFAPLRKDLEKSYAFSPFYQMVISMTTIILMITRRNVGDTRHGGARVTLSHTTV